MVKRCLIKLLVAAVFLMLFSLRFVDATIGSCAWEHPLESGWKSTGLILEEVDTETWTKVENRWMDVGELKKLARKIATKLRLRLKSDFISGNQGNYSYISFEGVQSDQTRITVTIQSCQDREQRETQMGIYTCKFNPGERIRPYLENLKANFRSMGEESTTSVILSSNYKGVMKSKEVKALSRRVFQKLAAKMVEVNYQERGNNVYKGYTPVLERNPLDGSNHNFELSAKYDPQEKVTQVQLASPGNEDQGV